jgi:hypothetical protein
MIEPDRAYWKCHNCLWCGPEAGAGNGRSFDERTRYEYGDSVKIRTGRQPPYIWEHRDADGSWTNGGGDLPSFVLYRLEEALEQNGPVAVVEGEKDVDTLWRIGVAAVCNAHGAGKWKPEHSEQLRGRDLYVFNDNDEPGYAHARLIIDHSLNVAKSIRRVDLVEHWPEGDMPAGADVSDFLTLKSITPEDLYEILRNAPLINGHDPQPGTGGLGPALPGYTADELETKVFEPLKMIVPTYIPEGVTLLAGKSKIGKSWMVLDISYGVARGEAVLGELCQQRDVVYFALEDTERRMQDRTRKILGGCSGWPSNLTIVHELPTIDRGGIARLQQYIDANPKLGLIIIDTYGRFRGSKKKEDDNYTSDYNSMSLLNDLYRRTGVSIIAVHHTRKNTTEDPQDNISGTMGLPAGADSPIVLYREGDQLIFYGRGRDLEEFHKTMDFDKERGLWSVVGDYEPSSSPSSSGKVNMVLNTLKDSTITMTPDQIAKATGLDVAYVRTTLNRLNRQGKVSRTSYGSYEAQP